jgi:hypothetical protein
MHLPAAMPRYMRAQQDSPRRLVLMLSREQRRRSSIAGMISAGAGSYAFTGTAATLTLFADASGAAGQVMGLLAGITKAN